MAKVSPFTDLDLGTARALLRPGVVRNRRHRPIVTLAIDCPPDTSAGWIEAIDRHSINATFYVEHPFPSDADAETVARRLAASGHEFGLLGDLENVDDLLGSSGMRGDGIDLRPTAFAIGIDDAGTAGRRVRALGFASCRGANSGMMTETIDLESLPAIPDPGESTARQALFAETAASRAWLVLVLDARHPFGEADGALLDEIVRQIRETGLEIYAVRNALGALAF